MRFGPALPSLALALLSSTSALAAEPARRPATAQGAHEAQEAPDPDSEVAEPEPSEAAVPVDKLLVLDVADAGAGPALALTVSEAIGVQAGRSARGDVVTVAALRATLDAAALAQLTGCAAEACMVSVAEEVEADRALGGTVSQVAEDVVITLLLVDSTTGARVAEAQRKVPAHPELVAYAARSLAASVLGSAALGEAVPVWLQSVPAGGRAFVDGSAVGTTPVVASLPLGAHELTFRADGFDEQRIGITVADGAPVVVRAALVQPAIRVWPLAASLGGVALLSGAGAAWAGIAAANAYDGSFALFTPDEDVAASYRHASPVDSADLSTKKQRVEQLALIANVLVGVAAASAVSAVLVEGADLALWAMSE